MSVAPAGPPGHLLLGNLSEFRADQPAFFLRMAREYGDVVRGRFLHLPLYMFFHPDAVKEILVDHVAVITKGQALEGFRPLVGKGLLLNEGESHRRQRRMMQPAFHRQRIEAYAAVMAAHAARAATGWRAGPLDVSAAMMELTLGIAAETLFGADLAPADVDVVRRAMATFTQWFHQSTHPLGPLLQLLPVETTRRFKAAKAELDGLVSRIVARRRAEGDGGDILSMLLYARDAEGDGAAMDEDHLHDEVVTLLVAGHETTAAALTWALHLLARHPEIQAELRAEVCTTLGDRPATLEDTRRLPLTHGAFAEALRLYPVAPGLARQAQQEVTVAGVTVPKGAFVTVSQYATQRDPRWWPEPEAFRPARWAPEARAERPKYAYFPFGGGARVCIGEAFAWAEGVIVLAEVLRRWSVRPIDARPVEHESLFTMRPKGGLRLVLEPLP